MTRDDVIRMARTAGAAEDEGVFYFEHVELAGFAALVAAHEREECAKVAGRHSTCANDTPDVIAVAIRARGTHEA